MKLKTTSSPDKTGSTRWRAALNSKTDDTDMPPLGEDFFKNAFIGLPPPKDAISLRIDRDVLNWFKSHGQGYQTRMNAVLTLYAELKGMKRGHNKEVKKHEKVGKK